MEVRVFYEPGYGWRAVVYRHNHVAHYTSTFGREEDARRGAEQWVDMTVAEEAAWYAPDLGEPVG